MDDTTPEAGPFRILFVCTGNTCRSPLAEVLAARAAAVRGWAIEAASAGVAAYEGAPASEGSLRAAERHGLDLSGHRARAVTREILDEADLVLTMSPGHLASIAAMGGGERAALLTAFASGAEEGGGRSIPDPFGGPDEVYEATFQLLERLVDEALARLEPILSP